MGDFLIGLAVAFVGLIVFAFFKTRGQKTKSGQSVFPTYKGIMGFCTFISNGSCSRMVILKRDPVVKNAITINASREAFIKETPDQLIYTGATVGGITTGGFHVQKGGTSIMSGRKTGKYYLSYKHAQYAGNFYIIELSTQDFYKANENPKIRKLIATQEQIKSWGSYDKGIQNKKTLLNVSNLTQEQANAVVDFLAGD